MKNSNFIIILMIIAFCISCKSEHNQIKQPQFEKDIYTPNSVPQIDFNTPPPSKSPENIVSPLHSQYRILVPTQTPNKKLYKSFFTNIIDQDKNRIENLKIASEEISGTIIKPNEVFSFNQTLGQRSKEKGYKKASIILNGEKAYGVGGGVCQISSTLYNAALESGLLILERHQHSKKVPYIKEGKDAAVVYGAQDLKFKNSYDFSILLKIKIDDLKVTAEIISLN